MMKKLMKKQFYFFVALVAVLLVVRTPSTYAASISDLKSQKNQIEQQKNQLNSQINKKSGEINTIENKQDVIISQIKKIGEKITDTDGQIETVGKEIDAANKKINVVEKDIAALQEKIDQRDQLLEDRARALQENGSISYLDVLLGANSFVDFIDRFSAVNTLMEADRQIIRDQKNDKQKLEEKKLVLENTKKELEKNHEKLKQLKASLDSQKAEKNKLIDELEAEQAKLHSEKKLLEKEYSEALEVSQDLQQKITAEQNRQLSLLQSNGGNSGGSLPAISSSSFTKPTNGTLTSGWGWRNFGGGSEFHYGVDLANASGTPIVAAASGVVSYAAPLSTYGNVVIMTHSINGKIYTTVYAHLSSFNVGVGDVVNKGEQIARMGSTGRSTGPHVHFEIHIGTWQGQKPGNVNPLRYISL